MFIGHLAVGFASKKFAPNVSLGWLVLAPVFLDLLWPVFILLGIEKAAIEPGITAVTPFDFISYPYSHSMVMSLVWAVVFGGVYFAIRRDSRASLILAFGVFSHWILDVVSHRPDMPVGMNGPYIGLELWASHTATMAVEGTLFALAVWTYVRVTRSRDRIGRYMLYALVGLLAFFYLMNLFGPPPPSILAVAVSGIVAVVVFTPLFHWMDLHREAA